MKLIKLFIYFSYVIHTDCFPVDGHNKPKPREDRKPLSEPSEYMCLIRAKAKKNKLATIVSIFYNLEHTMSTKEVHFIIQRNLDNRLDYFVMLLLVCRHYN